MHDMLAHLSTAIETQQHGQGHLDAAAACITAPKYTTWGPEEVNTQPNWVWTAF